ncbi:MAG: pantoate--beta-alanine ligase [Actinomycetes bacterium]
MESVTTVAALRSLLADERRADRTIGFVPTMGYLHAGHASLIERAASECDTVVVSVFVNPLQFGASEDLATYPRDPDGDAATIAASGGAVLFLPTVEEMYPMGQDGVLTSVAVADLSARWEGASRPGHFAGVCTVVAKLFNMVGPCRAYFGEKDYQQLAVVAQMVRDLSFPVTVVGCPVVRESDGLAMSSRNVRLGDSSRLVAPILHRALEAGAADVRNGERSASAVHQRMAAIVGTEAAITVDYLEVVDPVTLEPVTDIAAPVRLIGAVLLGGVRLLDNVPGSPGSER